MWINLVIKVLCVLALATLSVAQRNPPPCSAADVGRWVNDFGGCPNYFYCETQDTVRLLTCPENTGFDQAGQICARSHVAPPTCEICPAGINSIIAVANDAETCTNYAFCFEGLRDAYIWTCPAGTRFDRAWGQCRPEALVDCPRQQTPPAEVGPPCTYTPLTDVPHDTNCWQFWSCGSGFEPPTGPYSCDIGMRFDKVTETCSIDATCIRPAAESFSYVPQAPVEFDALQPSFGERLMQKLHIR